jgi:hypothetical protein
MRMSFRWALVLMLSLSAGMGSRSQGISGADQGEATRNKIAGVWRGNSVCLDSNGPCHDEVNVYRFAAVAGHPDEFTVTASKVVDGKVIVMGSGEWKYDAKKQMIEAQTPLIRLTIDGDKMEGVLALANGTVYRRISLHKEAS